MRMEPERLGFSSEALTRIDRFFEREIAADRLPGAVVAIAREGQLAYHKAFGHQDKASGTPMTLDAMFHLASMTKVMCCVGGLALNEEGRLPLRARLSDFFPAFANMTVGEAREPAKPIHIHDLYRHTSGMTYGARGTSPVHKLWPEVSGTAAFEWTGDELIARLSTLPLLNQPGTSWEYGFSTDVLGLVIEKVTGMKLGAYLKQAIWDKVRMPDTTFEMTAEQRKRLARPLPTDPLSGKPQSIPILDSPVKFHSAGTGTFGTVGDYLRFAQMLANGGELDGTRVLSPKTVAFMASDHLGPHIKNRLTEIEVHREGYAFGLGVAVRVHDGIAAIPGSKGDFTWNGASGTGFWVDPAERLAVVFGTAAPGDIRRYYREQMDALVYGAMTRSLT